MDIAFHSPIVPNAGFSWAQRENPMQVTSRAPVLPDEKGAPKRRAESEEGERNRRPVIVEEDQKNRLGQNDANRPAQLSPEEQKQLRQLKARDAEVRAHEAAHLAAAGGIAISGASFETVTGPDGQQYAVGGEVSISVSEGKTPEETLRKARRIQAAALAPAQPSSTDQQVAARAASMAMEAAAEIAAQKADSTNPDDPSPSRLQQVVQAYSRPLPEMPPRLFAYA